MHNKPCWLASNSLLNRKSTFVSYSENGSGLKFSVKQPRKSEVLTSSVSIGSVKLHLATHIYFVRLKKIYQTTSLQSLLVLTGASFRMLICVFAIILFNGGNVNGGCVSSFDPDVVRLIEAAFNNAKSAVQQDHDQRTLFLNKGADTHDVNSVDGQLDLFTFEDNQAHRMSDEGMKLQLLHHINDSILTKNSSNIDAVCIKENANTCGLKKITLSELKSKYNKEWLMITTKYPLTKPVVECDLSYPYRTADGSCNNEKHVLWGKSDTLQPRFLDPDYDDGIDTTRVKSVNGGELPSARKVSNLLMKCDQVQKK
ncbi:hypothetical protein KUTeg_018357 [Tegillarca granosa]|uniref:Uncharacterized protein n=1 Tax=Tegillarca granosa TaxID=220873 RepID=A0ABQ9EHJ9_TEGGR|nr:hypothetical protein KUTeg_018357 [Tegillarca granosa]